MKSYPFFVFDVESIGLHGEAFAVAGGVFREGHLPEEFLFACNPNTAKGEDSDRKWVKSHVPDIPPTHDHPGAVRDAFWATWLSAKAKYPGLLMAVECGWPVEATFLSACVADAPSVRGNDAPYPCHDVSSIMLIAGMDVMASYDRLPEEMPHHHPTGDARLSARLLFEALNRVSLCGAVGRLIEKSQE